MFLAGSRKLRKADGKDDGRGRDGDGGSDEARSCVPWAAEAGDDAPAVSLTSGLDICRSDANPFSSLSDRSLEAASLSE